METKLPKELQREIRFKNATKLFLFFEFTLLAGKKMILFGETIKVFLILFIERKINFSFDFK